LADKLHYRVSESLQHWITWKGIRQPSSKPDFRVVVPLAAVQRATARDACSFAPFLPRSLEGRPVSPVLSGCQAPLSSVTRLEDPKAATPQQLSTCSIRLIVTLPSISRFEDTRKARIYLLPRCALVLGKVAQRFQHWPLRCTEPLQVFASFLHAFVGQGGASSQQTHQTPLRQNPRFNWRVIASVTGPSSLFSMNLCVPSCHRIDDSGRLHAHLKCHLHGSARPLLAVQLLGLLQAADEGVSLHAHRFLLCPSHPASHCNIRTLHATEMS